MLQKTAIVIRENEFDFKVVVGERFLFPNCVAQTQFAHIDVTVSVLDTHTSEYILLELSASQPQQSRSVKSTKASQNLRFGIDTGVSWGE